ncbi:MAG: Y-family DNA polymerase, partial [Pseudomonadota bacterium]
SLRHRPIVVLSNNDGCIVARSNEAKALGVPMGGAYHSSKAMIEKNGVAVFSSNYQFYGDMSHRVMNSLRMLVPDMEVYSIDEAFLRLDSFKKHSFAEHSFKDQDVVDMAANIRTKVYQWTGIPTAIGIAPTKTLAKIASHVAKKRTGVFVMHDPDIQNRILRDLRVEVVWGISRRWGDKLRALGIQTALQLREADARFIRQHFSVVGERIVRELKGVSCLGLEEMAPKRSIMSSKSFGQPVSQLEPMEEAISHYAARACEKLRKRQSKAQGIHVFVRTNPFRQNQPQYRNGHTLGFDYPASDTAFIIQEAKKVLKLLYRKGYKYLNAELCCLIWFPKIFARVICLLKRIHPERII